MITNRIDRAEVKEHWREHNEGRVTQQSDCQIQVPTGHQRRVKAKHERRQKRESSGNLRGRACSKTASQHETRADQNRKGDRLEEGGEVLRETSRFHASPLDQSEHQNHCARDRRSETFRDSA